MFTRIPMHSMELRTLSQVRGRKERIIIIIASHSGFMKGML